MQLVAFLISFISLFLVCPSFAKMSRSYNLLTASYSAEVHELTFEPPSTLKRTGKVPGRTPCGEAPSWIAFAQERGSRLAYVIDESNPGHVFVVRYGGKEGPIQLVGKKDGYATGGDGSVAACVQSSCLYVANYMSGSASVLTLDENGLPVGEEPANIFNFSRGNRGVGPVKSRQDKSYAHDATASPDGVWVYFCDLGADRIHRIRAATRDQGCSAESYNSAHSTVLADGSGPRHLAFHRDASSGRQFAYLSNELTGTVVAFEQDRKSGALEMIGKPTSALPENVSLGGSKEDGPAHFLAEVAISGDGRFVYVSDRADPKEDYISIFRRNPDDGSITLLKRVSSGGSMPRHFSISHDDQFVAVANRFSKKVVILKRDTHSGDLSPTGAEAEIDEVVYAGFVLQ